MALSHKNFNSKDITYTKTLLHEAIPLTGAIVSGTYSDNNVKNYSHGMFQSVYDYPYLSSSANHVFDVSLGYAASTVYSSSANTQNSKKINIYNQMAQVLVGYDSTGSVRKFDEDGDHSGGSKIDSAYFLNLSRLLTKDEIKKGSFSLIMGMKSGSDGATAGDYQWTGNFDTRIKIADTNAQNDYRVNSPAGDYGILYATEETSGDFLTTDDGTQKCGLIFYQAGIVVLTSSIFLGVGGILHNTTFAVGKEPKVHASGSYTVTGAFASGSISGSADALRARIYNLSFNNTTELNSAIYFCRINHNDFNYSSNPTYLASSKIRTKNQKSDPPVSYITSVGLYSADQQLLAVAKLSEPLKNSPDTDMTLRVRLDY